MKHLALFCLFLSSLLSGVTYANTVSKEVARARAKDFFTNAANEMPSQKGRTRASSVGNLELAYTSQKDGKTCFYVFNNGADGGFVIVGGDDAAKEILAYVPQGHFEYEKAPDNFKWWLGQFTNQIAASTHTRENNIAKTRSSSIQKENISDLITTKWDQSDPYNRAIPKLVDSNDGTEYAPQTGCVATAMAQVMKYWNYPEHGLGIFESATYDWANMVDYYTGEEPDVQINAVAQLMYHAGIACQSEWGRYETSGSNPAEALKKYFGYSEKAKEILRYDFDDKTWEEILYSELKKGRPVLYSGGGDNYIEHQYIIHGYSANNNMFKINWGWGGLHDGYTTLTPVSESNLMGYSNNQSAIIMLQPTTLDNESTLDYGDIFWANDLKFSIISSIYNTVQLERPDEKWYTNSSINVPETVDYQGEKYCVISIGEHAFMRYNWVGPIDYNNTLLPINEITLPESLRMIRTMAFSYCEFNTPLSIPNSVTYLGHAIMSSTNIEEIVLPSSLTSISDDCFSYCRMLQSVKIPEGITKIGAYAFSGCENLRVVETPSTLNYLERGAFMDCNKLETFICRSVNPPSISEIHYPFPEHVNKGSLFVPEESLSKYKESKYWQDWGNVLPFIQLSEINFEEENFEIEIGTTERLHFSFSPVNASSTQCIWSSSDPSIVWVDQEGEINATSTGTVIITVSSLYDPTIRKSCTVTVVPTKWELIYLIDGEEYKITKYSSGSTITPESAPPAKEGYIFYRWIDLPEDLTMPDHNMTVTAVYALIGDVNFDEKVNITDAVDIVSDRLGYESSGFVLELSDVNADEQYTIADVISVINIMYGEPANASTTRSVKNQTESLALRLIDDSSLALDINSVNAYAAFQFDLELPDGAVLEGITLNKNRCNGFAVAFNKVDYNVYRVVAYNLENEPLSTGNDNLLKLSISSENAKDKVNLTNIHFSTQNATDVLFDNLSVTRTLGIQINLTDEVDEAVYNSAGVRVNENTKGFVIVKGKKFIRK